jgi:hypothetical protein
MSEPAAAPVTFPDAATALAYLRSHDERVRQYSRQTKAVLLDTLRRREASLGITHLIGNPARWSKEELLCELVHLDYPPAQLKTARSVYYASWDQS